MIDIYDHSFLNKPVKLEEIKAGDFVLAFKIMKDLGKKWEDFDAYKLGLIDKDGKKIKNASTATEKDAISSYMKIIFNLKRILQKAVKSNLGQKIVTAFLLKEGVNRCVVKTLKEKYHLQNFDEGINETAQNKYVETFLDSVLIDY